MFSCRFHSLRIFFRDKFSASCKCTITGKPNVIKKFNTDNKYLFGSLLESRKQKRLKAIESSEVTKPSALQFSKDESANGQVVAKKKSRTQKLKDIQNPSELPATPLSKSLLSNNVSEDNSAHDDSKTLISKESTKRIAKSKTAKGSVNKVVLNETEGTPKSSNVNSIPVLSDKLISKTTVPVNDLHYPLDNPDKSELSREIVSLESVLSYGFTDPLVKDYKHFPSVSKIMEDTMPVKNRVVLKKWRENMIADLGEEGFAKHCTGLKTRGHEFHEAVRNTVLGHSTEGASEVTCNALRSLEWLLESVTNPLAVESIIAHPHLEYKGIPDCVAMFKGIPVVIDWKLSEKPKKDLKDTYDAPVQIAAYIGALNHDPNYKWKLNHGLVAVAYTSGNPCDVFLLAPKHCEIYWRHWLLRCDKYKAQSHLHLDHDIDEKALELL